MRCGSQCQVELCVGGRKTYWILGFPGFLERSQINPKLLDVLRFGICCSQCRNLGLKNDSEVPEFSLAAIVRNKETVDYSSYIVGEHRNYVSASTILPLDEAALSQQMYGFSNSGPINFQQTGKFPFRRQSVARPEFSIRDLLLNPLNDLFV